VLLKLLAFMILLIFHGHTKTEIRNVQFVTGLKLKEDISDKAHILLLYFIDFDFCIFTYYWCCFIRIFHKNLLLFYAYVFYTSCVE